MFLFGVRFLEGPWIWITVFDDFIVQVFLIYIFRFSSSAGCFVDHVNRRVSTAYCPYTLGAPRQATVALALFCLALSVPFPYISVPTLLSFLEFLHFSGLAVPTIKTYFSSIKARFRVASLPLQPFSSPYLALAFISLEKTSPPSVSHVPVFTHPQLIRLILTCSSLPLHPLYSAAFSFAFLAMLLISNLAPSSPSSFDPLQHLHRGDVTLHGSGRLIHLCCSKTLQRYNQSVHIPLFPISSSPLCPIQAFLLLQRLFLVHPMDSLLS
jgi:hypothetical protein